MQYVIATYLVDREIRIDAYTEDAIRRPAVLDRIDDIEVIADPSIVEDDTEFNSRYKTRVEAETFDGELHSDTVSTPPGFPENSMSDEELIDKSPSRRRMSSPTTTLRASLTSC